MKRLNFALLFLFVFSQRVEAQQIADASYLPVISNPAYSSGAGPVVFIDEGHHNFHTKDGRYTTFAKLLERDGYQVNAFKTVFEEDALAIGKVLVISNALNEINVGRWILPTPSAFSDNEIRY
jgi:hypothetical protein